MALRLALGLVVVSLAAAGGAGAYHWVANRGPKPEPFQVLMSHVATDIVAKDISQAMFMYKSCDRNLLGPNTQAIVYWQAEMSFEASINPSDKQADSKEHVAKNLLYDVAGKRITFTTGTLRSTPVSILYSDALVDSSLFRAGEREFVSREKDKVVPISQYIAELMLRADENVRHRIEEQLEESIESLAKVLGLEVREVVVTVPAPNTELPVALPPLSLCESSDFVVNGLRYRSIVAPDGARSLVQDSRPIGPASALDATPGIAILELKRSGER